MLPLCAEIVIEPFFLMEFLCELQNLPVLGIKLIHVSIPLFLQLNPRPLWFSKISGHIRMENRIRNTPLQ